MYKWLGMFLLQIDFVDLILAGHLKSESKIPKITH